MSGPPPWTTIGFRPTYLSSTTSRANSSRRPGSSIAAPPYLMTTVFEWNSRMYGSASSSVPTSCMCVSSCRVLRIDRHVPMGEIGEEDLCFGALSGEGDLILDLRLSDSVRERLRVVVDRCAGRAYGSPLDRQVNRQRRGSGQRGTDRLDDPPPV